MVQIGDYQWEGSLRGFQVRIEGIIRNNRITVVTTVRPLNGLINSRRASRDNKTLLYIHLPIYKVMADEKPNISETNKKINEVKKKIALCEGKRRAAFSVGAHLNFSFL